MHRLQTPAGTVINLKLDCAHLLFQWQQWAIISQLIGPACPARQAIAGPACPRMNPCELGLIKSCQQQLEAQCPKWDSTSKISLGCLKHSVIPFCLVAKKQEGQSVCPLILERTGG